MTTTTQPGPRHNFPAFLRAIKFQSARWLVIEIHKFGKNTNVKAMPIASAPTTGLKADGTLDDVRRMPFDPGAKREKKPDALDVKKDKLLQSVEWHDAKADVPLGDPQPGFTDETRNILFINLSLLQKDQKKIADRRVTVDVKLEGIKAEVVVGNGDRKFAYWMWETEFLSSSNGNLGIGPPPTTMEEALTIKTFTYYYGATSTTQWIAQENHEGTNAVLTNANRRASQVGVAPAPLQSNDGWGWATEADQTAAINYLNAYLVWNEQFSHEPNHQTYFAVTLPITGGGPKTTRRVEYEIKAGYYAGRLQFPYDTESNKQFPPANEDTKADDKAERYAEYTITKTQPSEDSVMRIVLDSKNHVKISQES